MDQDPTWRVIETHRGTTLVRLVDVWIAVTEDGEILVRDVWEVRSADDDTPPRRVMTFTDPDDAQLMAACLAV